MAKKLIITIARQYGSGGREIGEMVAKYLGIPLYDKQLITDAASKGNLNEEVIKKTDESAANSLLYTLAMGSNVVGTTMHFGYKMPINDKLFNLQADIIKEEAMKAPSVFVGRCADYVLNECKNVIKVFLYADVNERAKRIAEVEGVSESDARVLIYKTDKRRANYYNYYTSLKWGKSENYNLMIDTGAVGIEGAAKIIGEYIKILKTK